MGRDRPGVLSDNDTTLEGTSIFQQINSAGSIKISSIYYTIMKWCIHQIGTNYSSWQDLDISRGGLCPSPILILIITMIRNKSYLHVLQYIYLPKYMTNTFSLGFHCIGPRHYFKFLVYYSLPILISKNLIQLGYSFCKWTATVVFQGNITQTLT